MAKIVLTISANNQATQSVKLLNAEVETLSKTLSSITVNKDLTTQINALTRHYQAVAQAHSKIIASKNKEAIADEKLRQQLTRTQIELTRLAAEQTRLEKAQQKTTATTEQMEKRFANLLSTIKSLKTAYPKGTFDSIEQGVRANLQAARDGTKGVEELSAAYSTLSKDLAVAKAETEKVTTAVVKSGDSIGSLAKKFLLWQVTATLVMKPIRMLTSAWQSLNDTLVKTEDTVIAVQRVVQGVTSTQISDALYDLAIRYGQTFDNVQSIALDFARTGLTWSDAIKATEAALLGLNTAELSAEDAAAGLIAVMQQFGLEASQLESIIDKLNITQDNAAVTTDKLLAALQRTGSSASNANLSLEETVALITALSAATGRSGQNIGTALNSLIQYSRKESALNVFAGLSDESAAVVDRFRKGAATILDVWQQVSKEIQSLDSRQADLLDSYFNTEDGAALSDALDGELEDIYTEMNGVFDTANTFRKNYFIALLGNMSEVETALGRMDKSVGYSQKQNNDYMKSYTARLNSLKAKWQQLVNDEQGFLGFKKGLVDFGDKILTIINYTGKLTTVFLTLSSLLLKVYGARAADWLATQITSWSKLSRIVKGQATPAIQSYSVEIKRLKAEILATVDSEVLLEKQTELLALKQKRLSATFKNVSTAISAVLIVFAALNAIQGAIDEGAEKRKQAEEEKLRTQNEAIAKSVESIEDNKELAQSTSEYADTVERLRKVLESTTASESEKQSAQSQLLAIQNSLIESNADYAGSLDLINGKLIEQLELVEKMSDAQLKKQAQQFLDSNYAEIANANKEVTKSSSTSIEFLNGTAFENDKNKDFIRNLIEKAKEQGIDLGAEDYVNVPTAWTNFFTYYEEQIRKAANGQETTVWDWLGFTGVKDFFSKEGWAGSSWAGISTSGTVDEQLESLRSFRQLIIESYEDLGLTYEESIAFVERLDSAISQLDTTEYQNAKTLAEKAKATEDFIAGTISREEYLRIVYGIESDIVDEEEEWHNNIAKVTKKYDDLISRLEELRDLNKEAYDWEEKKLAVLEAEQALENARNEATVRRFNQETGQWEWQTDEKAIKEAEENLEKARLNLEEAAYNNIIDQLKEQTATNESILAIIEEVAPLLGEDFASAVQNAIKDTTRVDLSQPVNSYDSGGIANGLGYMPKATAQPETVNNPELTAKILSPVSNTQFDKYVRDMGIMFEMARQYSQTPVIERVGGATDNRVDNSGQITMNGVTIGSDRRGNSLDELLMLANIIPKV